MRAGLGTVSRLRVFCVLLAVRPGEHAAWFCSDPHLGPSLSRERGRSTPLLHTGHLGDIPAWPCSRGRTRVSWSLDLVRAGSNILGEHQAHAFDLTELSASR